jgi:hypothetical protein
LKPILGVAATGVVAFLVWKALFIVLFPLIGIAVGLVLLVAKVIFVCVMVCVAVWLFRRLARREEQPA